MGARLSYSFAITPFRGSADIVMLGDSLTEWGNWHELVPEYRVINRGISGDNRRSRPLTRGDRAPTQGRVLG